MAVRYLWVISLTVLLASLSHILLLCLAIPIDIINTSDISNTTVIPVDSSFFDPLSRRTLEEIQKKTIRAANCYLDDTLTKAAKKPDKDKDKDKDKKKSGKEPKEKQEDVRVLDIYPSARWPTAIWRKLDDKAFRYGSPRTVGLNGLTGCTCVIAMTANHVWMAHLWEVPGFSESVEGGFPKALFQDEVLDFIKNGIATVTDPDEKPPPNPKKGQTLGERKAELKGADVWILTLAKDKKEKEAQYPERVSELRAAIEEQIEDAKFHLVYYERPPSTETEVNVMELLFEYDPAGKNSVAKNGDQIEGMNNGKKWARFFYQNHLPMFDGEPGKFG